LGRVLVIDDDIDMTAMLTMVLGTAGFDVKAANTSLDGVNTARSWSPDVIILDLMMPGMDGLQVCHEVRQFSQVPILILSVVDKPGTIAQALDEGADDYLVKPVPGGVLIAHINTLSRRNRPEAFSRAMQAQARFR
jgi:DNA-binding response OmpR family regulator